MTPKNILKLKRRLKFDSRMSAYWHRQFELMRDRLEEMKQLFAAECIAHAATKTDKRNSYEMFKEIIDRHYAKKK